MDSQNYGGEGKIENIKYRYHKAIKHLHGVDISKSDYNLNGYKRDGQCMCCSCCSLLHYYKLCITKQKSELDNKNTVTPMPEMK
jgi:hypothetical protein